MLTAIIATDESERVLVRTLASLVPGATAGLIRDAILADAGSTDDTGEIGDIAGCRLLVVQGSLGRRLAAAAAEARGDWLLFVPAGAELDPGWVVEVTQFIERAPNKVAGVFALAAQPHGQESLWRQLLAVMRSRGSLLKHGRGLLISRAFYAELGGHSDRPDSESALLRSIGKSRIAVLRSPLSRRD